MKNCPRPQKDLGPSGTVDFIWALINIQYAKVLTYVRNLQWRLLINKDLASKALMS